MRLASWSPALAAVATAVAVAPRRTAPRRAAALVAAGRSAGRDRRPAGRRRRRALALIDQIGRAICSLIGADLDARRAREVGLTVVAAVVSGALHPLAAAPGAALAWAVPEMVERSRRRSRAAQVAAETPDLVELFRLAVGAGLNVRLAVDVIAPRARGLTGEALARVPGRVAVGERLCDALETMATCGDPLRPLVVALVASERYGVALGPTLERVAFEARLARRRRAEEEARRLPVLLLFPLVVCILPAFVLLTVVPMLLASAPSLTG